MSKTFEQLQKEAAEEVGMEKEAGLGSIGRSAKRWVVTKPKRTLGTGSRYDEIKKAVQASKIKPPAVAGKGKMKELATLGNTGGTPPATTIGSKKRTMASIKAKSRMSAEDIKAKLTKAKYGTANPTLKDKILTNVKGIGSAARSKTAGGLRGLADIVDK